MRIFASLAMAVLFSVAAAQDKTYSPERKLLTESEGGLGSMVIIPFEDKMYLSEADAVIGMETGLQPGELQPKFKNSLLESLESSFRQQWAVALLSTGTRLVEGQGLDYIYSSVGYRYTPVSADVLMANDTTLKKKDIAKAKKKKEEGISNGEISAGSESAEQFMTLVIKSDSLLPFLDSSLGSDYYLFLTEFDVRHFIFDPDRIASGGLMYRLKIHFSCIDKNGKALVSGMASTDVSAEKSNIYVIISEAVPALSDKLYGMITGYRMKQSR